MQRGEECGAAGDGRLFIVGDVFRARGAGVALADLFDDGFEGAFEP